MVYIRKRKVEGNTYYDIVESKRVKGSKDPKTKVIHYIKRGETKKDIIHKIKDKSLIKQIDWQKVNEWLKGNVRKKRATPLLNLIEQVIKEELWPEFWELKNHSKLKQLKSSNLRKSLHILIKQGRIFVAKAVYSSDYKKRGHTPRARKYYTADIENLTYIHYREPEENINFGHLKNEAYKLKKDKKLQKNPKK